MPDVRLISRLGSICTHGLTSRCSRAHLSTTAMLLSSSSCSQLGSGPHSLCIVVVLSRPPGRAVAAWRSSARHEVTRYGRAPAPPTCRHTTCAPCREGGVSCRPCLAASRQRRRYIQKCSNRSEWQGETGGTAKTDRETRPPDGRAVATPAQSSRSLQCSGRLAYLCRHCCQRPRNFAAPAARQPGLKRVVKQSQKKKRRETGTKKKDGKRRTAGEQEPAQGRELFHGGARPKIGAGLTIGLTDSKPSNLAAYIELKPN